MIDWTAVGIVVLIGLIIALIWFGIDWIEDHWND